MAMTTALSGTAVYDGTDPPSDSSQRSCCSPTIELSLLGGFAVAVAGRRVPLSESSQRVLAFVALRDRPVTRALAAGTLWIDHTEARAAANLRSALWRLNQSGVDLIACAGRMLELSPQVRVDVRRLLDSSRWSADGNMVNGTAVETLDASLMAQELLPDWYEDWVILDRERLRQLRLHLLDSMCIRLTAAGRLAEAIDAGLVAIAAEPLRESAHRAVIQAHLAEGNLGEARRQYEMYAAILGDSLNAEPSLSLRQLLAAAGYPISTRTPTPS
jgi:DNA-binding SARP family transcriptional activator